MNLGRNDGRDAKLRGDKLFIQGRLFRYDAKVVVEVKSNLIPVQNPGPPPIHRLPNDLNDIPLGIDSDVETVVPSTTFSQAVSIAKRTAGAVVIPNDLYRPGTRNVAPSGSHSSRTGCNRRPRGAVSRDFFFIKDSKMC
jgi:hypothetical protein